MSEVSIANEIVRFTRNDVGPNPGDGRFVTEQKFAQILNMMADSRVASGFSVPTSANLTTTVAAGIALVKGYFVDAPATNITVGAGATTYVFLALKKDVNGNVTEAIFELNTSGTPTYSDSILLARLTSSGTAITAAEDLAPRGQSGFIEAIVWSAF